MATEYVVRARFTGDARDLTRAATEARTDLTQLGQSAAAAGQQMARQGAQADTSAKAVQAAATAAKAAARSQLDLAAAEQQAATSAARATAARAGGDRMTDARQQRALAAAAAATTIALRDQAAQLVTSAQSAAAAAAGYADLTAQIRAAGLAARRPVGAPAAADEAGGDTGGQSMSRQQRAIASALKGASAALDANAAALARAQAAAESAGSTYTTTAEAIYGVTRAARSLAAEAQVLTVSAAREAAAQQATTAALVQGAKARLVLAGASDRAAAATANLRGSNDNLARSAGSAARSLADQARQAQGLHAVTGAVTAVLGAARGHLIGLASVAGAALVTRKVAAYADSWTSVSSRLSLVTQGSAELARAQADLFRTAQDTRSEFVGAANLFATLSRQAQTLGASYKQLLLSTTAIGQAFVVSGASAESYQQAIIQLGQGLSAGAVMGEELNSILEQAPRLAQAIADGLGVGVAELKALGSEGKLTSKAIFEAILKEAPKIEAEFARMKPTISGAFTVLNNAALQWIGQADQASGASADVAQAIMGLADNLDGAATVVGVLGAVVTATLIGRALGPLAAATSVAAAGTKAMWQAVQDGTAIGLGSSAEMQARARHTLTLAKAQAHGTELTLGAAKAELAHAEAMATATKGAASWQTRVVEAAANVAAAEAAHAAATDRVRTAQTALATALQATTLRARAATTAMAALNAVGGGWGLSITALTLGVGYLATRTTDADKATEAWTDRITAADKALRELTETGKARAEQIKTEQDNLRAAAEAEAALAEARATAAQALADRTGAQWGIGGVALRVVGLDQARELGEAAKVARQQLSLLRATIGDYVGEVGGAARWTGGLRREITSLADVTASAVKPLGELLTKTRDLQAQRTAFGSGGETALREVQAAQQARDLLADAAKDRTQGAQAQLAYVVEQARAIGIAGKTAEEVLTNLAKASKDAEAGLASDQRQRQIQAELRGAKEVAAAAKVSAAAEREADLRARARVEALGQVDRTEQQIYETLLAQSDAERAGDEARRGRQTAQDLDLARQELALAGASTRERERALALARVNADLKARDISLTSDIARAEHERALAAIDAASAIEDAGALKAGQDRLKALDAEIKTIGQGAAARAEAVAVEQVQQSLRERSIALTSRQAGEEIKLAKQAAQRAAILKAGDEAADMDAQAAAAERMTVAITAGGDAVRAAARDEYARALVLQLGTQALVEGTAANEAYLKSLKAYDRGQVADAGQAAAKGLVAQRQALQLAQQELGLAAETAQRRDYLVALRRRELELQDQYNTKSLPQAAREELALYDQTLRTNALIEARTAQSQAFTAAIQGAAQDIQGSLADAFESALDGGEDAFDDFGAAIVGTMKRAAAQIAALLVFRPLVGGISTSILGQDLAAQLGLTTSTGGVPLPTGGVPPPTGVSSTSPAGAQTSGGTGLFSGVTDWIDDVGYSLGFGSRPTEIRGRKNVAGTGSSGWTSIPLSDVIGGGLQGVGIGGFLSSLTGGNSTGGMIGGGLSGALGTAVGGPIGGLIGSALGGLVGGLFGNKEPSNYSAGAWIDAGTGDVTDRAYTRDQRNVSARDALLDSIGKVGAALEQVTGGSLDGVRRNLDVGSRDGIQWGSVDAAGNLTKVRVGDTSESGAKEALAKIAEDLAGELAGEIAPEIQTAIGKIDWSDLEEAFADLQFAANYKDSLDWLTRGWDLANNAAKSARDSAQAQIDALAEFRETAARLGQDTDAAAEATKAYVEQLLGIREAAPAVTDFQAAMIGAEAAFEVYAKSAEDFGLTAAQVAAALEARKDQIANDYRQSLDRQLREARGLGVVDQVADLVKEAEAAARDAMTAAGQAGVDQVGELLALRVRNLIEGSDLTSQAIDALAAQFPDLASLIRQTAAAASESGKAIRAYMDDLATSAAGAGNPASRFQAAQDQFARDLSAARSGDRDALSRITDAAQTLLDAGAEMYGSGVQQAALVEWVRSSLSALPATQAYDDVMSDNTASVSALTAAIEALTAQLTASVASASAAVAVVPGYATGGVIGNGVYNKDSVIARFATGGAVALAGGEHVTRAASVTPATLPVLDAINATGRVPAMGGDGATAAEVRALRDEVRALRQELAALRQTTAAAGGATVDAIERQTGEVRLGRRATERATAVAKMGRGA